MKCFIFSLLFLFIYQSHYCEAVRPNSSSSSASSKSELIIDNPMAKSLLQDYQVDSASSHHRQSNDLHRGDHIVSRPEEERKKNRQYGNTSPSSSSSSRGELMIDNPMAKSLLEDHQIGSIPSHHQKSHELHQKHQIISRPQEEKEKKQTQTPELTPISNQQHLGWHWPLSPEEAKLRRKIISRETSKRYRMKKKMMLHQPGNEHLLAADKARSRLKTRKIRRMKEKLHRHGVLPSNGNDDAAGKAKKLAKRR